MEQVRQGILGNVKDVEVFTSREFSHMTQFYWMFTTGAGVAVLLAAVLGLVVGFVVVAQTIYATTVDHLKEFGTLKAMGAPNSYVYKVIITQAAISAVMGYVLGMIVSAFVVRASQSRRRGDPDALADGGGNVFSDAADVRERGAGFDQQSDAARSRDGVQGLSVKKARSAHATSHCSAGTDQNLREGRCRRARAARASISMCIPANW